MDKKRRNLLRNIALTPLLLHAGQLQGSPKKTTVASRVQYSVNAYSFNKQLRSGEMTFLDMMEFAAEIGLNAVDLTGYYFSTYPDIPADDELFVLKQKALELGLNITWTGIKNDFVNPNAESRKADIELIRNWLGVSSKLGASIMRVFAGAHSYDSSSRKQVRDQIVAEFSRCIPYAAESGVVLGLQNHDFFLYADDIINILQTINSKWFGLVLDVGSLYAADPYIDIKKLAPFANYWFIKEFIKPGGGQGVPINMKKIADIVKEDNYQGYLSFENLSDGDSKATVARMHNEFRKAFEN